MQYGFVLPHGDARVAMECAHAAEEAGWDGFFMWDPVWGIDPWVSLAAIAVQTTRIRLGTMITPVSRRRPWKLASETATLDNLSNGRVILATGLGAVDTGFGAFGEMTDRKTRAELLDEGLAILAGLWKGQPFAYEGKHYHVRPTEFFAPAQPVQQPRIPIWVVGAYPRKASMARALRWDGLLPARMTPDGRFAELTPDSLREITAYVREQRASDSRYDIVVEGRTPGEDPERAVAIVSPWAAAGATWWIESMWEQPPVSQVVWRIRQGPPARITG
jgi:alkanesulfonate monooxygenase SsuD/methylene tetrahydromethanopterin reductase-like flavin-dependent oxidoreductase (luciferase family)